MKSWDELDASLGGRETGQRQTWDALDEKFKRSISTSMPKEEKAAPVTDFTGNLQFGPIDTGIPLPQWANKALAQLGSGFADWGIRADQLRGNATAADVDQKRALDAKLLDSLGGKALNFTGKIAPSLAIPFVGNPIVAGAVGGAATGFMEPVGTGESAMTNTALGAGLGAALPAAVSGVKWLAKPNEAAAKTFDKAQQYGIPLSVGDVSQNGLVKGARSMLNDMPFAGAPGARLKEAQQQALNRAVGAQFGAAESRLTPDIMDAAKSRMGAEFDRLWGRNSLDVDGQLFQGMQRLEALADEMPKSQGAALKAQIADFWSKAQSSASGLTVPGEVANKFQQNLRKLAEGSDGYMRDAFAQTRKEIIGAFNRSITPADAAALSKNMSQYKAFKTVQPLLDKGAVGAAGRAEGDIPAALLPEAVRKSYSGLSANTNPPPLADIAQVAGRFLVDRTPQTGGSARAFLQNSSLGGLLGLTGLPMSAALNSPTVANALLRQQASRGLLGLSPKDAAIEASLLSASRIPLGLPLMFSPAAEQ